MWECEYGREPIDYRLIWLRFLKKIWIIPAAVLAGVAVVSALYYFARITANGGRTYQAQSMYYITFAQDEQGKTQDYYNYFTWNEVIHTDFFMDEMAERFRGELTGQELAQAITASVESDVRYLYVRCNTHDAALSVRLAREMEKIVPRFAQIRGEIANIEIAASADGAPDSSKLRMGNACFLGACMGLAVSVLGLLLALAADPAVYLPTTIERRWGLPCLGAVFMPEFEPNCERFLKGAQKVALVSAETEDLEKLPTLKAEEATVVEKCQNPVEHPKELERIRACDRVVLSLHAGRRNHKIFERLMEQLNRQGIKADAVVLNGADQKLIAAYYRSRI